MKKMGTQAALLAAGVLVAALAGCSDSDDEYYYTYSETDVTASQGDTTGDEGQEVTVSNSGDVSLGDLVATVSSSNEVSELVVEGYSCTGSGEVWLCQQETDGDEEGSDEVSVYVVTISCGEDGTWSYTAQAVSQAEASCADESGEDESAAEVVLWLSDEGEVLFVTANGSVCEASEDGWLWEADDGTTYSIELSQGEGGEWTYTLAALEDDSSDEEDDTDDSDDTDATSGSSSSGSTSSDSSSGSGSTDDSSSGGSSDSSTDDSDDGDSDSSTDDTGDEDTGSDTDDTADDGDITGTDESDDEDTTGTDDSDAMDQIIASLASNSTIVLPSDATLDDLKELIEAIAEGEYTGLTLDMSEASLITSLEGDSDDKTSLFVSCPMAFVAVILPDAIESVDNWAFKKCTSIESVVIPDTVTYIGISAFNETSITSIDLPSGVTSIGKSAFYGCTALTSIKLSSELESIAEGAFYNCTALTSIDIPSGVTSIEAYTFYGCTALTSIDIPSGVTSIEAYTFYGCTALTSIEIPSGVTSIGQSAFYNCTALTSIEIPSGVTSIEAYTFLGCTSLESVIMYNNVESIGEYAFYNCTALASIEIPSGVTSIGKSAFYGCTALTSIDIPSGVTSIEAYTFYGCTALTSIEIPSGVTSIGQSAFYGCTALTSIDIPSGVTSIEAYTFRGCTALTSIEIPSGVTSIGQSAFYGCTALKGEGGTVTYYGTQAEFAAISIGDNNECLTGASSIEYKGGDEAE